jgi:hypothetical protein
MGYWKSLGAGLLIFLVMWAVAAIIGWDVLGALALAFATALVNVLRLPVSIGSLKADCE